MEDSVKELSDCYLKAYNAKQDLLEKIADSDSKPDEWSSTLIKLAGEEQPDGDTVLASRLDELMKQAEKHYVTHLKKTSESIAYINARVKGVAKLVEVLHMRHRSEMVPEDLDRTFV